MAILHSVRFSPILGLNKCSPLRKMHRPRGSNKTFTVHHAFYCIFLCPNVPIIILPISSLSDYEVGNRWIYQEEITGSACLSHSENYPCKSPCHYIQWNLDYLNQLGTILLVWLIGGDKWINWINEGMFIIRQKQNRGV